MWIAPTAPYQKRGRRGTTGEGCQLDLLVQTEGTICIVESKRKELSTQSERQQALPQGDGDRFGAGRGAELFEDGVEMGVDAVGADADFAGDSL